MTFETITVAEADGVVTLTLNRPDKLNALNVTMGEELCAALEAVGKSSTARVLVVTGAGRMFSAGGDLASMDQVVSSAAAIDHSVRIYCEVARRRSARSPSSSAFGARARGCWTRSRARRPAACGTRCR